MSLNEYKRKRDFQNTPEPAGNGAAAPGQLFVVQKHAARRLHYDFRLELDGALKSWAVPKGPSLNPADKALAVHVEDHPLEYASFEGVIPQGQYGGGTVMVWDHGTWEPEGDAQKQFRAGKLKFRLHGQKLHGAWSLVRMSGEAGDGGKNWLLIKRQDKSARKKKDILAEEPRSAVSGREMNDIASDADRVWESNGAADKKSPAKKSKTRPAKSKRRNKSSSVLSPTLLSKTPGARRAKLPATFKPQLASLASSVPDSDKWLHELKFDGYRLLAFFDDGSVRLLTRNGNDWTKRFKKVAAALGKLPLNSGILDGEIVSLDNEGISDFQQLQNSMQRGNEDSLVMYLFDAPFLNGLELTDTPLIKRKELLAKVLLNESPDNDGLIRYSDDIQGQGRDVLAHACRYAMEGVVSKRTDSQYQQARTTTWLKVKCLKRQEFVIVGYTKPSGSRIGFGALLLSYYEDDELVYAGRVGTGFTHDTLREVHAELKKRRRKTSPLRASLPRSQARGVTWVRPELVAEVEFTEWTNDGVLRHPSFLGLREDKSPEQIVREVPRPASDLEGQAMKSRRAPKKNARRKSTDQSEAVEVAGVRITHPDRVLYPEQGLTKQELAEFYESIADRILPYIANRPLTLVRCPRGRSGDCFYQKHLTDSLPNVLRGVSIREKNKRAEYVVLDDVAGLVSLVQMGVLEIHPWGAKADKPDEPDQIVIDLDPGPGVAWPQVVAAARDVRAQIVEHELECFVRTSGGKGLHVVIPLAVGPSWDDVKSFAKFIAVDMANAKPDAYVATSSKAKRQGKVFVDYLRNSRGATSVACYSTRARSGAPVAVPLRWDELSNLEAANQYNVANIKRRLAALKSNPWESFFHLSQSL